MKPKIVIIGAGGHGKVILDCIIAQGHYEVAGFVDDSIKTNQYVTDSYKIIASQKNISSLKNTVEYFIVAIGNNKIREELYTKAKIILKPATIIHPSATIGLGVDTAPGCMVLSNVIINTYTRIGENTIINSGVIIDHECVIGKHVHLSIGSIIGSNSSINNHCTTEIGEIIPSFSKPKNIKK
jgi:sugar O-acyltransferase (sialic acid O-acetyltransferase NeuD family)